VHPKGWRSRERREDKEEEFTTKKTKGRKRTLFNAPEG
jgi:hypothetical protein